MGGFRSKRSLFIFHTLSFWNGYFGSINIFMGMLCIWMMNECTYTAKTEAEWEVEPLSCINLVASIEKRPRSDMAKSEREKRISHAFNFSYWFSFILVLFQSLLIFLVFRHFFLQPFERRRRKRRMKSKKSTRKYGFLALMRNIFPFQHSIPGNCKKVETRRMFDIGKERCQSFVNIKILRVCVHGLIFILMFNPNLFAVQVQLSIMLELSWRITKLKEKRSVLLSI